MALISSSVRRAAAVNLLAEGSRYGRFRFLSQHLSVSARWRHGLDARLCGALLGESRRSPRPPAVVRVEEVRSAHGLDRREVSRRLIACPAAQGSSVREISEALLEGLGVVRGHSAIAEDVRALGGKAEGLLDALQMEERVSLLAADEVYSGDDPILMTVEPGSLAWLSADRVPGFNGKDWATRFLYFPNLREVVSDGGPILRAGVRLVGLKQRFDHFHALRALGTSLNKMESKAF